MQVAANEEENVNQTWTYDCEVIVSSNNDCGNLQLKRCLYTDCTFLDICFTFKKILLNSI